MNRNDQRGLKAVALLMALMLQWGAAALALAQPQPAPHVPTEEELNKRITGVHSDTERGYQAHSVETAQSWTRRAIAWVRDLLARIHLTPARVSLGLGVLGTIYTAGKNKRLVKWMVLAVFSWLLTIVGACAMFFNWPYMN